MGAGWGGHVVDWTPAHAVKSIRVEIAALRKSVMNETEPGR